jgi:adenylate kinase
VRLLLLAPPGAGKGTQGERLAARSAVRHIAAGDLLRAEARAGGRLGREIAACQARGDLVPDQIVLDVLTPPAVPIAGCYRLATAPLGRGERVDLRGEPELRQAADLEVGERRRWRSGGAVSA